MFITREVRPLSVRLVSYAVETETDWCTSFNTKKKIL